VRSAIENALARTSPDLLDRSVIAELRALTDDDDPAGAGDARGDNSSDNPNDDDTEDQ
jgi:hypothetical protein